MAEGSAREAVFLARADVRGDGGGGEMRQATFISPPSFLPSIRQNELQPTRGGHGGGRGAPWSWRGGAGKIWAQSPPSPKTRKGSPPPPPKPAAAAATIIIKPEHHP